MTPGKVSVIIPARNEQRTRQNESARKYRETHQETVRAAQRNYKVRHPERIKETKRRYRLKHKDRLAQHQHAYHIKHQERRRQRARELYRLNKERVAARLRLKKYGVTAQMFAAMLAEQNNACASCRQSFADTPCVDHDHETRSIRGLLCGHCNFALGHAGDSPGRLRLLADYLEACHG